MPVRLRLINEFAIEVDGAVTHRLRTRKTEELVAFLAVHSPRWVPRSEVIDQIWEGDDEQTGRRKLRLALHSIRSVIGDHLESNGDLIRLSDVSIDFLESSLPAIWRLMPEHGIDWLDQWAAGEQVRRQITSLKSLSSDQTASELMQEMAQLIQVDPGEPDLYLRLFQKCRASESKLTAKLVAGIARAQLGRNCPPELLEFGSVRVRSDFFGRVAELVQLTEGLLGLSEPSAMTLVGLGGMGKSRLAQELIQLAPEDDIPAAFVSLSGISDAREAESQFTASLKSFLGLSDSDLSNPTDIPTCLIVLDNADGLEDDGLRFLDSWLVSGSGLRVLVTTQRQSHRVGTQFQLSPLSVPTGDSISHAHQSDAFRLLVQQSGVADSSENLPSLLELARLTGGIPLALRMAAAECRYRPISEVLSGLKSTAFNLKFGSESQAANSRHISLEATLEWSFSLLTPDVQDALTTLAHHEGGFTTEALRSLKINQDSMESAWVFQINSGSWNMLPPIRQFLRSKSADKAEIVRQQIKSFLIEFVEGRYPLRYAEILPVSEVHEADFYSLFQAREEIGLTPHEVGLILAAMQVTAPKFGRVEALVSGLDEVINASREPVPLMRNLLGMTLYLDGKFELAAEQFQMQIDCEDPEIRSVAVANLGLVLHSHGKSAEAIPILENSVNETRELRRRLTRILNLGSALAGAGRFEDALLKFQEAEVGFQDDLGLTSHEMLAKQRIAEVLYLLGREDEARINALACLDFYTESNQWHHICELCGLLLLLSPKHKNAGTWWEALAKSRASTSTLLAYAALALLRFSQKEEAESLIGGVAESELKDLPKFAARIAGIQWRQESQNLSRKTWISAANQLMKRL